MAKFKKGDKVTMIEEGIIGHNIPFVPQPNVRPIYRKIYTVDGYSPFCAEGVIFKEIPLVQNGSQHCWDEKLFEKVVEDKVEYRVVEVEIDKRIKEKRKEIIFQN